MQRVRFTVQDLSRITVAPGGDPALETAFAAGLLRGKSCGAVFGRWRDLTRQTVGAAPRVPAPRSPGVTVEFDEFHALAIAPHWERINAYLKADAEHRGRIFLSGGAEGLLGTLHAKVIWRPPVLEVDNGLDTEIEPGGTGLVIVPSLFLTGKPIARAGTGGAPATLVYPVPLDEVTAAALWDASSHQDKALGALMGRTRAAILGALTESSTTTQLGRRLGISAAAASQHTTVLREVGLITSRRKLNTVQHSLTSLGSALLNDS